MTQMASARLSEREVPCSILGDFNVSFDFPLIRVAIALNTIKRSTDRGRGVKGAPSASIDTGLVAEGTTDVKYNDFTFFYLYLFSTLPFTSFRLMIN